MPNSNKMKLTFLFDASYGYRTTIDDAIWGPLTGP